MISCFDNKVIKYMFFVVNLIVGWYNICLWVDGEFVFDIFKNNFVWYFFVVVRIFVCCSYYVYGFCVEIIGK